MFPYNLLLLPGVSAYTRATAALTELRLLALSASRCSFVRPPRCKVASVEVGTLAASFEFSLIERPSTPARS